MHDAASYVLTGIDKTSSYCVLINFEPAQLKGAATSIEMNIEIWSVGKENETFIEEGVRHYFRKTKPFLPVDLVLLSLSRKDSSADPEQTRRLEEALIVKRLQPHHYLVLLDERGKLLSSPQWAEQFQECMNRRVRTLVLLIGGAYGVSDGVKQRAQQTWSLSALVFPHQLVRLLVAEQVYRACSILHNTPYHHH